MTYEEKLKKLDFFNLEQGGPIYGLWALQPPLPLLRSGGKSREGKELHATHATHTVGSGGGKALLA